MSTDNLTYAGVGFRALACLIDVVILCIFADLIVTQGQGTTEADAWAGSAAVPFLGLPYFALAESSSWQGTPGKILLGLRVTDLKGARIGFGRAILRSLLKLVFYFIWFVSIFYVVTTPRKQALHDEFAGTVVLRDAA